MLFRPLIASMDHVSSYLLRPLRFLSNFMSSGMAMPGWPRKWRKINWWSICTAISNSLTFARATSNFTTTTRNLSNKRSLSILLSLSLSPKWTRLTLISSDANLERRIWKLLLSCLLKTPTVQRVPSEAWACHWTTFRKRAANCLPRQLAKMTVCSIWIWALANWVSLEWSKSPKPSNQTRASNLSTSTETSSMLTVPELLETPWKRTQLWRWLTLGTIGSELRDFPQLFRAF